MKGPQRLLIVDDLSESQIDWVIARASHHQDSHQPNRPGGGEVVGLMFLESSLRTRVGFASAAHRLLMCPVEIAERRVGQHGGPSESLRDTLRTVSGYVDLLVVRLDRPLTEVVSSIPPPVRLVNGGDGGAGREHPTQALIDLFAMERLVGPISTLHVALCGDLSMRASRSLLALLSRRLPAALTLLPTGAMPLLPPRLQERMTSSRSLGTVDVLHAMGIPHGVPKTLRNELRVDRQTMDQLPPHAVVLSPMPVIDEISSSVRDEPRVQVFQQSDLGLFVRMAVLELLLRGSA